MSDSNQPIAWKHLRSVPLQFLPLWIGSALALAVAGIGYSTINRDCWSASQPMVLRDEATGAVDRVGRLASQTELKAAQETILELARNLEVVTAALK